MFLAGFLKIIAHRKWLELTIVQMRGTGEKLGKIETERHGGIEWRFASKRN